MRVELESRFRASDRCVKIEALNAEARQWLAADAGAGEGWVRQIRLLDASGRSVETVVAAMTAAGEQAGEE